jgi:hypothetical protein
LNSPQRPIPKRASALPHPRSRCAPAGLMAGEPVPSVVAGCLAPGLPLRELGQSRRTLQSAPFISGDRRAIFDLAGWAVLAQRPFRRSLLRFICHHSSMLHLSRKFNFSQAGVSLLGCDNDEPDPRERGGPAGAGGRPRGSGSSDRAHRPLTGNRCNGDVGVLPEALPPIEPLAAGELEGALDGKEEEAEPALDGFDALLSLGWPFESLQCVETEMVLLLLAPAAGDEADCADAETAPKHSRVVASVRDFCDCSPHQRNSDGVLSKFSNFQQKPTRTHASCADNHADPMNESWFCSGHYVRCIT